MRFRRLDPRAARPRAPGAGLPLSARGAAAPMTQALLVAIGVMFAAEEYWSGGEVGKILSRMGWVDGGRIRAGEWWRLISPAFLHASVTHVAMNALALYSLGPLIERVFGRRRLLLAFILCSIGGDALIAAVAPQQRAVGASTGLWGLIALTAALAFKPGGLIPEQVALAMRPQMWRALLINGAISLVPGISMLGHLGGGVAGAALGFSPWFRRGLSRGRDPARAANDALAPETREDEPASLTWLSRLAGAAAIASVALALWNGQPWNWLTPPPLVATPIGDTGLTIAIPRGFAAQEPEQVGAPPHVSTIYRFGQLGPDPLTVWVHVFEQGYAAPAGVAPEEARQQFLEAVLANALKGVPADPDTAAVIESPRLERFGDRSGVLYTVKTKSGVEVTDFFLPLGARTVRIAVGRVHDAPPAWLELKRAIYASLGGG